MRKALARHNTMLDSILHSRKLPSDIYIVSRNKYYLNEIEFECKMIRRHPYFNENLKYHEAKKRNQSNFQN